ncbi:MAG: LysR family transcriptional regulator [Pseudomonadota bacterium]
MRHLKVYRAIKLIHRTGSIRRAAADLSISPSALNRSIQAFEDELSFPVFERVPGGVRLSEAGELLFDVIDRHLTEFENLQRQLGNLRDGDIGELRISLGTDIAAGLVLSCIAELEATFPGVSVELTHDNSAGSLRQRHVHLAVLTNPDTDDMIEVVHAHRCRLVGWQHGKASPALSGLWDLADIRVLLPMEATGSRTAISHLLRRRRVSLGPTSSLSAAQVGDALRGSPSVAIFPEIIFGNSTMSRDLHVLPLAFGHVQVCALRMTRAPLTRPAQAFLGILQRRLDAMS